MIEYEGNRYMNIAICDDNQVYVSQIRELLIKYTEQIQINVECFFSGEEFIGELKKGKEYDIIFLDIEMNYVSGLDVAEQIRKEKKETIIIFITSHVNYVSDTFRLGAFQFLTKPINEEDFKIDFNRAIKEYNARHKNYIIKWRDETRCIEYGDIYYIEAYNRHLFIHTRKEKYECVGKLAPEYEKLKQYNFSQCHKGFIVNLGKVNSIQKQNIVLKNNNVIPISRKFKAELMADFNLYLAGRMI